MFNGLKYSFFAKNIIGKLVESEWFRRHYLEKVCPAYTQNVLDCVLSCDIPKAINTLFKYAPDDFQHYALEQEKQFLLKNKELSPKFFDFLNHSCAILQDEFVSSEFIDAVQKLTHGRLIYSQEGEDVVLSRLFASRERGFFLDIGAHHPVRFSNTYALYRQGWRGINIDATPGSMAPFNAMRPNDINLECAIGHNSAPLVFYMFHEPALNTFDSALAERYVQAGYAQSGTLEMRPVGMADILDRYLARGQQIDLLSLDVEGAEMSVLESNNWDVYLPEFVIIEVLDCSFAQLMEHPIIYFLANKGYDIVSKLGNSVILKTLLRPDGASRG